MTVLTVFWHIQPSVYGAWAHSDFTVLTFLTMIHVLIKCPPPLPLPPSSLSRINHILKECAGTQDNNSRTDIPSLGVTTNQTVSRTVLLCLDTVLSFAFRFFFSWSLVGLLESNAIVWKVLSGLVSFTWAKRQKRILMEMLHVLFYLKWNQ